jgi:tetratricopeptide (TPR) repeat protein
MPQQVLPQLAIRLREALTRFPDSLGHWQALLRVLRELGRTEEAMVCADEALNRFPGNVELRVLRIRTAIQLGDAKYALADARKLWNALPESSVVGRLLLDALKAAKHWDEVETTARDMEWARSDPQISLEIFADRWIVVGRLDELLRCCDLVLAQSPAHTDATYYRAIALAILGREVEAREAMGLDRYLSISKLPVPTGYADEVAFRDALVAEIRADPTLMPDPNGKATRDGLQTLHLHLRKGSAVSALVDEIKIAVAAYVSDLAGGSGRFEMGTPKKAEIHSWAVVYGQNGRQKSHRHPAGWLSGVFYVFAPKLSTDSAYRGALKIGVLHEAFGSSAPWGIREIEPVPGRLVLFPSHTPHATEPSGIEGARICVAFDIVPI